MQFKEAYKDKIRGWRTSTSKKKEVDKFHPFLPWFTYWTSSPIDFSGNSCVKWAAEQYDLACINLTWELEENVKLPE